MPLFLHRKTRVCSASRPYFLGTGSARKHAVPLGAIPCLNYRRALDDEAEAEHKGNSENTTQPSAESSDQDSPPGVCPVAHASAPVVQPMEEDDSEKKDEPSMEPKADQAATEALQALIPAAKIVTVNENTQKESVTPEELNTYCQKLFRFKEIRVLRFRSWNARRKFTKNRKHIKNIQRPTLPDGTKLIKFPILAASGSEGSTNPRGRKEWIMNPNGKSFVCILHEYVQHALKTQPTYEFKELQNAATPYSATVSVNNLKYGTGYGTSKKQAKSEAARETLEILIPDVKDKITGNNKDSKTGTAKKPQSDLSVRAYCQNSTYIQLRAISLCHRSSMTFALRIHASPSFAIRLQSPRPMPFCWRVCSVITVAMSRSPRRLIARLIIKTNSPWLWASIRPRWSARTNARASSWHRRPYYR